MQQYKAAYDRLDARAAASLWPSVDARRLADIFGKLREQHLELTECQYVVSEYDAVVKCSGTLRYVRRVGAAVPLHEQHLWTIYLEGEGDSWRIVRVAAE
jgi:hypothetical protein